MLHCPLQIPAACTPHEHHWSSNYYDTQFPKLFQCILPPSPPSHLTLQSDEHHHSSYKTPGQLYTEIIVKLLTYRCCFFSQQLYLPAGTLKLKTRMTTSAITFIFTCTVYGKVEVANMLDGMSCVWWQRMNTSLLTFEIHNRNPRTWLCSSHLANSHRKYLKLLRVWPLLGCYEIKSKLHGHCVFSYTIPRVLWLAMLFDTHIWFERTLLYLQYSCMHKI